MMQLMIALTHMQIAQAAPKNDGPTHWVVWEQPPWVNFVEYEEEMPKVSLHVKQLGPRWSKSLPSGAGTSHTPNGLHPPFEAEPEREQYLSVPFNWTGLTKNPPVCFNHPLCIRIFSFKS